nr:MAG TPA: hypothetical protein [Caudoviricetes sp.]
MKQELPIARQFFAKFRTAHLPFILIQPTTIKVPI